MWRSFSAEIKDIPSEREDLGKNWSGEWQMKVSATSATAATTKKTVAIPNPFGCPYRQVRRSTNVPTRDPAKLNDKASEPSVVLHSARLEERSCVPAYEPPHCSFIHHCCRWPLSVHSRATIRCLPKGEVRFARSSPPDGGRGTSDSSHVFITHFQWIRT